MTHRWVIAVIVLLLFVRTSNSQTAVQVETAKGGSTFNFPTLPRPAINDAAAKGKWALAAGHADRNSGPLTVLTDGRVPEGSDQPVSNFFFAAGSEGGLLTVDLGAVQEINQVVTYSWHSDSRAPQVYTLYAATGQEPKFSQPMTVAEVEAGGWHKIASVDTRNPKLRGGQHAAKIADSHSSLGSYRHLLFAVEPTEREDAFGNTFFSEIDVVVGDPDKLDRIAVADPQWIEFQSADNSYSYTIDVTQAPELRSWTEQELRPVIEQWYPKIVALLPSEGFEATHQVRFQYLRDTEMKGTPAYASGGTISMNADWFRGQLDREARGAVVHEMVHVVQGYPSRSRRSRGTVAPPGWITEGIPDYIRWFLYEPQTNGAKLSKRALANAKHDASYRTSANFIDWVVRNHSIDGRLLENLNAAARQGKYSSDLWQRLTGKSEEELADAWRSQP